MLSKKRAEPSRLIHADFSTPSWRRSGCSKRFTTWPPNCSRSTATPRRGRRDSKTHLPRRPGPIPELELHLVHAGGGQVDRLAELLGKAAVRVRAIDALEI